ncbi:hypothetical protein IT882_04335 [Microbacterium schleiferi]|uniref:Uncharacterized protein n=1 Tax=Microbacterium schleiferi TaxID=69362 RepID=A0A7S8RI29_9MICO|nr:hypothetical protein [Microbacterium schleiferi]QPE05302.1 hypothetical protein IT882_04335 [Microbacterium schleiferi]
MVRDIPRVTDAMLDHIGAQSRDKGDALDAIGKFLVKHPEHDHDPDLIEARLALL